MIKSEEADLVMLRPWWSVPFMYRRIRFTKLKWRLVGECMYNQACWMAKLMPGRVRVRYWRAPTKLRYFVGEWSGLPSVMDNLAFMAAGVRQELQCNMLAWVMRSVAYCSWERNRPWWVWWTEMPRKCCSGPRSDIANSDCSWLMKWQRSEVELAIRMMSSA
jgi:hypothetical protein